MMQQLTIGCTDEVRIYAWATQAREVQDLATHTWAVRAWAAPDRAALARAALFWAAVAHKYELLLSQQQGRDEVNVHQ